MTKIILFTSIAIVVVVFIVIKSNTKENTLKVVTKALNMKQPSLVERTKESDNWEPYKTRIDDKTAYILYDKGIRENLPIKERPILVKLIVNLKNPDERGMPENHEFDLLNVLEDDLVSYCNEHNLVYVGRITVDGIRAFYIYVDELQLHEKNFSEIIHINNDYTYKLTSSNDKNYETYWEVLYPSEEEQQVIGILRVIKLLEDSGDAFEKAREIDHFIYFKETEDRKEFRKFVVTNGFKVEDETEDLSNDEPYCIHIVHTGIPTLENMVEVVIPLFTEAKRLNGTYDGWGSPIMK